MGAAIEASRIMSRTPSRLLSRPTKTPPTALTTDEDTSDGLEVTAPNAEKVAAPPNLNG
jgi:hypothetical protein